MFKVKKCTCGYLPLIIKKRQFHKVKKQVWCPKCDARSEEKNTQWGAIKNWNKTRGENK